MVDIKYCFKDKTPGKDPYNLVVSPAIYRGFKEVTPESQACALLTCPRIYSSENDKGTYLIIGKRILKDSLKNIGLGGLEKNIGEDEVLIEVPKGLINDLKK